MRRETHLKFVNLSDSTLYLLKRYPDVHYVGNRRGSYGRIDDRREFKTRIKRTLSEDIVATEPAPMYIYLFI